MTKVVIVPIQRGGPEYLQDLHFAVEVRDTVKGLVHRWTYRTWEKAEIERKRIALWFFLPTSVLPDSGVVAT